MILSIHFVIYQFTLISNINNYKVVMKIINVNFEYTPFYCCVIRIFSPERPISETKLWKFEKSDFKSNERFGFVGLSSKYRSSYFLSIINNCNMINTLKTGVFNDIAKKIKLKKTHQFISSRQNYEFQTVFRIEI